VFTAITFSNGESAYIIIHLTSAEWC